MSELAHTLLMGWLCASLGACVAVIALAILQAGRRR